MGKYQLRNTIIDLLLRIDQDSGYSHLLIDQEIKRRNISSKDEGLLTEIIYGTLQRKLTLDYYLQHFIQREKKLEPWVCMLLRMSIYQMIFLDRIPDHAIIHEAAEIAKQRGHKGISSFVNGVLRNVQRKGIPDSNAIENDVKRLAIETSHPQWLVERWMKFYGLEVTEEICTANLTKKPLSARVQPMKITRKQAMEDLKEQGFTVRPSAFSNQGIIIDHGNILHTALFQKGYITIQDQSSMLAGEMLQAKPEMHVLDTCSAPGGKTTHIAETMQNKGTVHAFDLHKKKLNLLDKKALELDLTNIETRQADARKLQSNYEKETFDRILVDAPCSGLGVIRGKPDIKYNKQEKDIRQLSVIQSDILDTIAPLLKKDGLLIYSTCTVDMEENEQVITRFLEKHMNFKVDQNFFHDLPAVLQASPGLTDKGLQLFPQGFGTDGFFLTRLIKKGITD